MKNKIDIATLPQPPQGSTFSLRKVDVVSFPHSYCITPKHVAWASDHCNGTLTTEAIREAEKHGAYCETCARGGRGILTIDQHENNTTLFIEVPQNSDLNAVSGLHSYLFNNKGIFEKAGIQGFAFPTKNQ